MVDTFHKLQENIRLRAYCGYSLCFFFFKIWRPSRGQWLRGFLSWPSTEALELFQQFGPKTDGKVLLSSLVPLGQSGRGGRWGSLGCRDGSNKGQAPLPALVRGLPQPDRYLSPKTPSLKLWLHLRKDKVLALQFLKNSVTKYRASTVYGELA